MASLGAAKAPKRPRWEPDSSRFRPRTLPVRPPGAKENPKPPFFSVLLSATFKVADYLTYDTDESFDLICLVYGDYGVLAPEQRRQLLQRAQRWLEPGGVIVLDVFSTLHLRSVGEASSIDAHLDGGFWSPNPHFVLTTRFRYEDAGAYLDRFLIVEEERQWEVFNWLQCFDRERLQAELTEVGLEVSAWLGSVAGDPFDTESPEFAVVARKVGEEAT